MGPISAPELLFVLFETVVFLSNWSAFIHYNIHEVNISLFEYFCLHGSQLVLYRNTGQILFVCLFVYPAVYIWVFNILEEIMHIANFCIR